MNHSLIDDVAHCTALHCVRIIAPCLREEEQRDAYQEFVAAIKAGLESFCVMRARDAAGSTPSRN